MNKTPIQWTDYTVNPFRFRNLTTGKVGHHCEKISPGCKFCYSAKMQTGPYLSGLDFIAENKPKGEFFIDENALQQVLRRKKPARIFWCDMTDMFLDDYPDEWIDRCFAVMALTPHLTHQVLTKRAPRMREYLNTSDRGIRIDHASVVGGVYVSPLRNVWLGVSVEDQQRKDRIAILQETPAGVRFLSLEPILEDLGTLGLDLSGISWVIVGGESGPGARPCDIAWVRSIVEQCDAAGVACFVKQLGAKPIADGPEWVQNWTCGASAMPDLPSEKRWLRLFNRKGGGMDEWPADLRVRQMPETKEAVCRA